MSNAQKCACAPDGPFCGACAYDEDGELIEAEAHAPARQHEVALGYLHDDVNESHRRITLIDVTDEIGGDEWPHTK